MTLGIFLASVIPVAAEIVSLSDGCRCAGREAWSVADVAMCY